MNRQSKNLARAAAALVAGPVLVATAAPALAAPQHRSPQAAQLEVTPFVRASTCPGEVDAAHPTCRVVSWTTAPKDGRTWAFVEMTTEQYDAATGGKTYVSDVQCDGPVRVQQRRGVITLEGAFPRCDVGVGRAAAGPYWFRGQILDSGLDATTQVNQRQYRHTLYSSVL
ncbi:hypothetical protein [Kineococcus rhizosphaerae]|uniref:Secreted protein n=1 Tax=Kineococcus rhizosphaerae TaxID=559628 RepID=A0A2T0R1H7_9ACTN|nr:hypothetical protein [Kineococcus rhizosphaerae]PRY13419.1 hypothetical protein CLV37_10888 [Kineococcus rhizosphaerae]